ncbi:transporter, major facilitator family protein, partial [Opisthorchis viverrini]|uniref:Uncharacterized protein n=2 Tax=Opisthorchis viverrini TaxID=6198 RepID=A0A074ZJ81_OPIVI
MSTCCDVASGRLFLGYRHCVMFLGLCGLAICYIMRISPAITIISMVDNKEYRSANITGNNSGSAKKFDWTPLEQNTILSSFFYSYFLMQLPAGWVTQHIGGKWTFATGVSFCGLIAIVLPRLVELGGFTAFLLLRISQGLFQGMCYPSIHRLTGYWYPPREYSLLSGIMHSGAFVRYGAHLFLDLPGSSSHAYLHYTDAVPVSDTRVVDYQFLSNVIKISWPHVHSANLTLRLILPYLVNFYPYPQGYIVGTVLALVCSGYLIDANQLGGWPLPFYVSGILAFIWLPAWSILITEVPGSHPWISPEEVQYIEGSLRDIHPPRPRAIPWRRLAASGQVWLIMVCYVLDGWSNYTLLVCVPQFIHDVLGVPISENGVLSALPYMMALIFMYLLTAIDGFILRRGWISMPNARKLWSGLSAFGKSILLLTIAYLDASHKTAIIILLVLNVMLSSATLLGFNLADLDLAPAYAGFLFSVFNACSTFSGIVAPLVVGVFTSNYPAPTAWRNVFVLASAISCLCGILFVLFGRQAPLSWTRLEHTQRRRISNSDVLRSVESDQSTTDVHARLLEGSS